MPGVAEYLAEFAGTACIMLVALSALTFDLATHSPMHHWVPNVDVRRLITGLIIGGTAATVIYSAIGRRSGGHFNPALTLAFHRLHKIGIPGALAYASAQLSGAAVGAVIVRLAWGSWATSVHVGATMPGHPGTAATFAVETALTFLLVTLILHCVDRPRWMPYTAALAGVFVAFVVLVEAPISGTSLNPARSFGPALAADRWSHFWIYAIAPPLGAVLAAELFTRVRLRVMCAKLFHTDDYPCPFFDCQYTAPTRRVHRARTSHRHPDDEIGLTPPEPSAGGAP